MKLIFAVIDVSFNSSHYTIITRRQFLYINIKLATESMWLWFFAVPLSCSNYGKMFKCVPMSVLRYWPKDGDQLCSTAGNGEYKCGRNSRAHRLVSNQATCRVQTDLEICLNIHTQYNRLVIRSHKYRHIQTSLWPELSVDLLDSKLRYICSSSKQCNSSHVCCVLNIVWKHTHKKLVTTNDGNMYIIQQLTPRQKN